VVRKLTLVGFAGSLASGSTHRLEVAPELAAFHGLCITGEVVMP
jgi:hypothetical protein